MSAPQETTSPSTPPANRERASFTSLRADVVYDIYEVVGQILERANMVDIRATVLEARYCFTTNFIDIKEPENLRNLGRCFRMRCDMITQTMDEMLERMVEILEMKKFDQQKGLFIADVMNMLANQVGRLTIYGLRGDDLSAQLMDSQSFDLRDEWYTATDANPDKEELQSTWVRLQLVHPVCAYRQCRRRNRHLVPRGSPKSSFPTSVYM